MIVPDHLFNSRLTDESDHDDRSRTKPSTTDVNEGKGEEPTRVAGFAFTAECNPVSPNWSSFVPFPLRANPSSTAYPMASVLVRLRRFSACLVDVLVRDALTVSPVQVSSVCENEGLG